MGVDAGPAGGLYWRIVSPAFERLAPDLFQSWEPGVKCFSRRWTSVFPRVAAGAFSLLLAAGCQSTARLDRQVNRAVERTAAGQALISTGTVAQARAWGDDLPAVTVTQVQLSLTSALDLAARHSRDIQARREQLYLDTLGLFGARRGFGTTYEGTVQYILNQRDGQEDATASGNVQVGRRLPTGGRLSAAGQASRQQAQPDEGPESTRYDSSARVRLDQPLLAGAGYEAGYGELIQAERDYVYAVRDFVLARQDQALQVMRDYFGLLRSQQVLRNTRKNVEQVRFLRQRSEALFKVSRAPAIDVLRSQQEELSAVNRLQSAEESYALQVSRFLVSIGLPAGASATVTDDVPPLKPLALEEQPAVQLGLQRRLDLLTALDRRADAQRNLRVARRGRLPDLNAYVEAATESAGAETWGEQVYEESQSAGLTLELPLDQRDERDAARRAALALAAADRGWRAQQDAVRLDIAESFSSLRTLRTSVEIEQRNIEVAEKRARNASLRFRNGELSNRDVIEAENDLLNARNAWVQALLDYELQRLQLLRNVGLLDVSPTGALVELAAPEGPAPAPVSDMVPRFEVVE